MFSRSLQTFATFTYVSYCVGYWVCQTVNYVSTNFHTIFLSGKSIILGGFFMRYRSSNTEAFTTIISP
jgi:hypothetical protein